MEIHPSITSRAIYGENGRAALPLDVFINEPARYVNKEHLGVPIVVALIQVGHPSHKYNTMDNYVVDEPIEYREPMTDYMETISPEVYNTLLNNVLAEPIDQDHDQDTDKPLKSQRRTRKKDHK